MRSVELCAGAGGMALGLHRAGIEAAALVEWDRHACATLRAEVVAGRLCGDVLEESAADADMTPYAGADLLAAGWPCQPFSTAGKRRGAADKRDGWPWITRALNALRPAYFLGENVSGLLTRTFDEYRRAMAADLSALGYAFDLRLLNAADYGVPQCRRRIILLAWRHGCKPWRHPVPTHHDPALGRSMFGDTRPWITAGEAIGAWPVVGSQRMKRPAPAALRGDWLRRHPPTTRDAPAYTVVADHGAGTVNLVDLAVRGRSLADVESAVETFLSAPALTVVGCPRPGVPGHHDPHTPGSQNAIWRAPAEWRAAWQTFPASWRWQGPRAAIDKQIGNAVPPVLAEAIGRTCPALR